MKDPRMVTLAHNLVNYSCKVQPGEKVLIENTGIEPEVVSELVEQVYKAGGQPFVWLHDPQVQRALVTGADEAHWKFLAERDGEFMSQMQAYIGLRAGNNTYAMADVPSEKITQYGVHYGNPVHGGIRVPTTKWVVLRYPTPSMAQAARKSVEAFEEYYFNVCNLDYGKMGAAMKALQARMEKTDEVRIVGPGTDLRFSIQGIPVIPCAGELNIPDGEIFTAPVRDSIEGTLTYNTPALRDGFTFDHICFRFEKGKIVEATANDTKLINQVLDTDEGARYVGEFAIGVNPYITEPMLDTLFDEKIAGSFHFTPGRCYDEANNGNKSAIHWDLVAIQTPEYGGGEMYFDGELIRKDGRFVPEDLHCLNPENLV